MGQHLLTGTEPVSEFQLICPTYFCLLFALQRIQKTWQFQLVLLVFLIIQLDLQAIGSIEPREFDFKNEVNFQIGVAPSAHIHPSTTGLLNCGLNGRNDNFNIGFERSSISLPHYTLHLYQKHKTIQWSCKKEQKKIQDYNPGITNIAKSTTDSGVDCFNKVNH